MQVDNRPGEYGFLGNNTIKRVIVGNGIDSNNGSKWEIIKCGVPQGR
jgi:hypothetical protein